MKLAMLALIIASAGSAEPSPVSVTAEAETGLRREFTRAIACQAPSEAQPWTQLSWLNGEGARLQAELAAGEFSVRCGEAVLPIFIQATHQFRDLHTGVIAHQLSDSLPVALTAYNRVRRDAYPGADLSRAERSWLLLLTQQFLQAYPDGLVVQLHGFAQDKRDEVAAQQAHMIISAGHHQISPQAQGLSQCLWEGFAPVLLYPMDTNELGGTQNRVGRAVNAHASGRFLHLELSLPTRRRLQKGDGIAELARCLAEEVGR